MEANGHDADERLGDMKDLTLSDFWCNTFRTSFSLKNLDKLDIIVRHARMHEVDNGNQTN